MENGLLKYAFFIEWQNKSELLLKNTYKDSKMKLPLHEFSFIKATAPLFMLF